ncbi:unnamed protein product [Cylicocyclus nassatus]|uniref:Neuropeptide-Like Protein n=1 Tax=Cylicocyclus nassatus TaxID=53992 RepID=A0AA36DTN3_CYLNA|nr:unnamed protein product [Cylicocyclus nassatus]
MNFSILFAFLLSFLTTNAYYIDFPPYHRGYNQIRRSGVSDYAKRSIFDDFDDVSLMRSIDRIQRPRFGRK